MTRSNIQAYRHWYIECYFLTNNLGLLLWPFQRITVTMKLTCQSSSVTLLCFMMVKTKRVHVHWVGIRYKHVLFKYKYIVTCAWNLIISTVVSFRVLHNHLFRWHWNLCVSMSLTKRILSCTHYLFYFSSTADVVEYFIWRSRDIRVY